MPLLPGRRGRCKQGVPSSAKGAFQPHNSATCVGLLPRPKRRRSASLRVCRAMTEAKSCLDRAPGARAYRTISPCRPTNGQTSPFAQGHISKCRIVGPKRREDRETLQMTTDVDRALGASLPDDDEHAAIGGVDGADVRYIGSDAQPSLISQPTGSSNPASGTNRRLLGQAVPWRGAA